MQYEILGRREAGVETVVLSPGLGGAAAFWKPQLPSLCDRFRVIVYDHRGVGANASQLEDGHSINSMVDDMLEVVDELQLERIHFVGHALGGLIGLQTALRRKTLIDRLVVVNGWSSADTHTGRCFDARRTLLTRGSVEEYIKAQPIFLYPAAWLSANADQVARDEAHALTLFPGVSNVLRRIDALLSFDIDQSLAHISARTLVAATKDDVLVPYTRSVRLAEGIPNATLQLTDFGGHGFTVTEAPSFNQALIQFLAQP